MLNDAKDQISRESIDAERRLAANTAQLALTMLQKSLSEFFSVKQQKEVEANVLKKINKTN